MSSVALAKEGRAPVGTTMMPLNPEPSEGRSYSGPLFIGSNNPLAKKPLEVDSTFANLSFTKSREEFLSNDEILTSSEIECRLHKHRFPELDLAWKRFLKLNIEPSTLSAEKIERELGVHMAPLSRTLVGKLGAIVASAASGVLLAGVLNKSDPYLAYELPSLFGLMIDNHSFVTKVGPPAKSLFLTYSALLAGALVLYGFSELRRRVFSSLSKITAETVGFMLSRRNFRAWHESTARAKETQTSLKELGVNENWDNPNYRLRFSDERSGYQTRELKPLDDKVGFIRDTLRDFLGSKEERAFKPGRYTPHLLEGKRSVTHFVRENGERLNDLRTGKISVDEALILLEKLKPFIKEDLDGVRTLNRAIEAVERGEEFRPDEIQVEVWQRDPQFDLTAQDEFYSSASLRGVKFMGRTSRGRLGVLGYLLNSSISALDFRSSKRRLVRARLGAARAKTLSGGVCSVLWVDAVEGSNSVHPSFIRREIERYAKKCGFDFVACNKSVHNYVPRRFVNHVQGAGLKLAELSIEYLENEQSQYLDAFGVSIEPLEYGRPRGKVIGYVEPLKPEIGASFEAPSFFRSAITWLKKNAYNLGYLALGIETTVFFSYKFLEWGLLVFPIFLAAYGGQHWYKGRSLRDRGG